MSHRLAILHATWLLISPVILANADEALPKTLMTTRGKLLVSEDFEKPLPPFTGTPVGFASGFSGWRYNDGTPNSGKSSKSTALSSSHLA